MQLEKFLDYASRATGLSESDVRERLRDKFGKYNSAKVNMYMSELHGYALAKFIERKEAELSQRHECPYHHIPTRGSYEWAGRYTHTLSWYCPQGGHTCFIRNKADSISQKAYGHTIDWEAFDARNKNSN